MQEQRPAARDSTQSMFVLMKSRRMSGKQNAHDLSSWNRSQRERDCFYYIIIQTYDVGLQSRRHHTEFDAGTRPFASSDAPSSSSRRERAEYVYVYEYLHV